MTSSQKRKPHPAARARSVAGWTSIGAFIGLAGLFGVNGFGGTVEAASAATPNSIAQSADAAQTHATQTHARQTHAAQTDAARTHAAQTDTARTAPVTRSAVPANPAPTARSASHGS